MKLFYDLTDAEKMDLYHHNAYIKTMADEMMEYTIKNFQNDPEYAEAFKDYSILDALDDIANNMDICRDEWLIIVSGYEIIEIRTEGYNNPHMNIIQKEA